MLIVSSLQGPLMFTPFHKRLISRRSRGNRDPNPKIEAQLVGEYKESADLMLAYLELIRFLSLNQPELGIVVKAHPDEDPESWRGILGETGRARVDTETPTSQLVRESVAVILSGSTVAFEAELSETPLISFQPIDTPYRALGFAESLGVAAKNVEEVDSILKSIINPGIENRLDQWQINSKVNIRQKVYFDDEELAAERMVDSWENTLKNAAPRPASSWSFLMSKEGLQYFVASAFPLLTSFLVRTGQRKLDAGPRKNYKRPPLNRKSVRARIEEMRSILGLQDSVSFRFRGRRGIVIKPSFRPDLRG